MPSSVIALFGPTASGKTAVAAALRALLAAHGNDAALISADSAALFAGLPIITAAPSDHTQLVGVVPLTEDVSLGDHQRRAHLAIDVALATDRIPFVVGGTGLYFRAAISSLAVPPPVAPERRVHWQAEYDRLGPEGAHALLRSVDAEAGRRVHANDRRHRGILRSFS